MTLKKIEQWHQKARPAPDAAAFNVQLGCHFEEFAEMLDTLVAVNPASHEHLCSVRLRLAAMATDLKHGFIKIQIDNRKAFLDSLADQVVTAIGVGHCAGMQTAEACERVNDSNWSKFVDGEPVFNEAGKVAKGPGYAEPDLERLY